VLVEAGVIDKREPHWRVDDKKLNEMDVPTTLTGVLQARIERLSQEERTLIQQASVVGRVFWDQAVRYLNHQGKGDLEEEGIQDGLSKLRGREMIYRRELSAFQEAREYIFKHAVLREVIYESVLKKLRRVYHALIAKWLMEQRADRSGEVVGLIADHLEQAGEYDEALRYLRWAGEEAAKKYANQEAVDYFTRALALVPDDDLEARFELLLMREEVHKTQAKWPLQRQDLQVLKNLAKEMGSVDMQLEVGLRWSVYLWFIKDYPGSAEAAARIVSMAEEVGDLQFAAMGELRWGRALIWMNQIELAQEHLHRALIVFRAIGNKHQEGITLRSLGSVAAGLHELQAWQDYARQVLSITREIGDRVNEAEAINHLGNAAILLGDFHSAQQYLINYLNLAREIGHQRKEWMALGNLGTVAIALKEYTTARGYHERALTIAQAIGDPQGEAASISGLGEILAEQGQLDAAAQAFQQAMEVYRGFSAEWGITDSRVGLAQVALAQGEMQLALDYVNAILAYLESGKVWSDLRMSNCYLVCVQVLEAIGDPRAREVLEKGYAELQNRAAKITDEALRRSFLENVPWRQELVKLWEEQANN
jgi:predicted ATPase